ncbi:MAG: FAD-binding dehydrogenase [Bacteroidia bacterium]|nr:FAD-binding dehydrogenase [Bacteroidia bacterium]
MKDQDIIVVGGGLAGISAALEALDQGLRVTILDRGRPERFGGLARWAFGGIFYVDSPFQRKNGFEDSPSLAFSDWCSAAEFGPKDFWPKKWAEKYVERCTRDVYEWLKPKGIKYIPSVQWVERGLKKQGNSVPRFHLVWGSGMNLANTLIGHLKNHPESRKLKVKFFHKVDELIISQDRVVGVRGKDLQTDEAFEYQAAATILAAGGITGSVDEVKKHWYSAWGKAPEHMLTGSHMVADGQIHRVAKAAGANVTHLDKQWNYAGGVHHPEGDHELHGLSLVPPKTAVWLDYQGNPIGPDPMITGFDTRSLVEQISQQEKQYSWQVTNYKIAKKELGVSGSKYNHALREQRKWAFAKTILLGNKGMVDFMINNCVDFVVADNLSELVAKMNELTGTNDVKAAHVKKAVNTFDEAVKEKQDSQDPRIALITRLRENKGDRFRLMNYSPIQDPAGLPFIAIREFILTRKSMGGIQTNLSAQVLSPEGGALEGLYAIGESAGFGGGGIHGLRALEGTFLGNCMFNARVAVNAITGKEVIKVSAPKKTSISN